MNWDTRRKIIYALTVAVTLSGLFVFLLKDTLFPDPTCFDKKQNGFESGIDCGGSCSLRCAAEVNPLTVAWAKALSSQGGLYDLAAMVVNTNINNASKNLGYVFTVYGDDGDVIASYPGTTTAPLDGKFPLIVQGVPLKKHPASVVVTLNDGPHYTVTESPKNPTIRIMERKYEGGSIPRVYAIIMNTKHSEIRNLPVKVMLFDAKDNVYAVGQTIIPSLKKEGIKEVVFTWNTPFTDMPRRIGIYPIFNPFEAIDY